MCYADHIPRASKQPPRGFREWYSHTCMLISVAISDGDAVWASSNVTPCALTGDASLREPERDIGRGGSEANGEPLSSSLAWSNPINRPPPSPSTPSTPSSPSSPSSPNSSSSLLACPLTRIALATFFFAAAAVVAPR
eukprot:6207464-Pleurochrysis_carterae.AAC.1